MQSFQEIFISNLNLGTISSSSASTDRYEELKLYYTIILYYYVYAELFHAVFATFKNMNLSFVRFVARIDFAFLH